MKNVAKAITLKKDLDALRPLSKADEMRIMQKFRLDWNYHSNHLEGNSLTYGETKALILFGITAQGKPLKDHIEMTGHNEAVEWILDVLKEERPLTENFIRELHKLILKEPYSVDAITEEGNPTQKKVAIGVYKTLPNHVKTQTGEIFRFATPEETPAKMEELIDWYRKKIKRSDFEPILTAAEFHYKFILIHPFDDGNGRTARILMNFILMQNGYPPVIIKTEDKTNYFAVLRQADAGIFEPFLEYIAQNLNHSLELMLKGAKGESIEEPEDLEKEIKLLEQQLKSGGKGIEKLGSLENKIEILKNSFFPLIQFSIDKSEHFKKIYKELSYLINFEGIIIDFQNDIYLVEDLIEDFSVEVPARLQELGPFGPQEPNHLTFKIVFSVLNNSNFDTVEFESSFHLKFDKARYQILDSQENIVFEKLYTEELSEAEIKTIVNQETKRHLAFIKELLKNEKKDSE